MIGVGSGHSQRTIKVREFILGGVRLGRLNAAFHFADRGQVFVEFDAVGWTELALKPGDFFTDRIKQACAFL